MDFQARNARRTTRPRWPPSRGLPVAGVIQDAQQAGRAHYHELWVGLGTNPLISFSPQLAVEDGRARDVDKVKLRALADAADFDFQRGGRLLRVIAQYQRAAGQLPGTRTPPLGLVKLPWYVPTWSVPLVH